MVWTTYPQPRMASATTTRPRLRSRKNSGGGCVGRGKGSSDVFERRAVVFCHRGDVLSSFDPVADVDESATAMDEERLAECPLRIGDQKAVLSDGQHQFCGPAALVGYSLEVALDHLVEHALTGSDHGEQAERLVAVGSGVIVEDLCAVGEEVHGGQGVVQLMFLAEAVERGTDPLEGQSGLSEGGEHHALGEPDERDCQRMTRDAGEERLAVDWLSAARPSNVAAYPRVERGPWHPDVCRGLSDGVKRFLRLGGNFDERQDSPPWLLGDASP